MKMSKKKNRGFRPEKLAEMSKAKTVSALKKLLPMLMKEMETEEFQVRLHKHFADISRKQLQANAKNAKWRKWASRLDDESAIFICTEHSRQFFGLGPSQEFLKLCRSDD